MSRLIFWALLGTVILSPVPFGSIYPWSYTLLAIIVAVLVSLWSLSLVFSGASPPVTIGMIWFPATMFGLVLVWIVIQGSSWVPDAWQNPAWRETAAVLGTDIQGYITVNPYATETTLMRLLSYAGIFWLALQFGRSSRRTKQVFYVVALAGLAYAAYGLVVEISGSESILWYEKEYYKGSLTSTFRYKNGYATYAGLGLIATMTLLVRALGRDDYSTMGPKERLRSVLTLIFENIWYLFLIFIGVFSALLLSDSRGGLLSVIIALLSFTVLLRLVPRRNIPYGKTFFAALLSVGILSVTISGGYVVDRFAGTGDSEIRLRIYSQTIQGVKDQPVSGWGANTFDSVFARYQDPFFRTRMYRAHNEYLDNALGMGIPATAALVTALLALALLCFRGTRRRQKNNFFPAAGFASFVLVGVHSIVDFTPQIPAVMATFSLLAGVCCAQSWTSLERRSARTEDRSWD